MDLLKSCDRQQIFDAYKHSPYFFAIIGSVLEGKQAGVILTDDHSNPKAVFVIHCFGFAQYIALAPSPIFLDQLLLWLSGKAPASSVDIPEKIRLYPGSIGLEARIINGHFAHIERSERIQWQWENIDFSQNAIKYDAVQFDSVGLDDIVQLRAAFGVDIIGRFWPSAEAFVQAGLGIVSGKGPGQPGVCLCYSAAVSQQIAEIDIFTLENFRGKGIASQTAMAFINQCGVSGLIPSWDCYSNNLASVALARLLGFKPKLVYAFYTINLAWVTHVSLL